MLYLVRGLPGSGKSTFAEKLSSALGYDHYEADDYHYKWNGHTWVYDWKPENVQAAHRYCQDMCRRSMSEGDEAVIVSNTFTTAKEMEPYLAMALEFGYRVTSLVVENRHGGVNIHNVPQATLDKMRNRFTIKL
ncbi:ATPase [Pseudomonas phage vB_PpuM-NoPa]|uniref:ATPase n=1 Tax=Pseudomonas phage vB_PpuM-NoPa TaxID=3132619 RepID=A0AAX4MYB1_9CAUD